MTTGEIEYPVVEESLDIGRLRSAYSAEINRLDAEWSHSVLRGDRYRARALSLAAQCRRLRTIAGTASDNERDALRQMLITRGAMAIMEDCERQQIAQVRAWIRNQQGRVMRSVDADALREIFGIEEAV